MSETLVVKYLCDRGTSTRFRKYNNNEIKKVYLKRSSKSGPNLHQLQNSVRSLQTQMTELHKQVVFIIERQTKILLLLDKENVNKEEPLKGKTLTDLIFFTLNILVHKKREDFAQSNAKARDSGCRLDARN